MAPAVRPAVPVWRSCLRRAHHPARKRARLAPGFVFPVSCHGGRPIQAALAGSMIRAACRPAGLVLS